ncbi:hypothetical protein [Shimia sp. R9_3]|uniref:hypothetical protein n=1 Tax=Shimia sp. R9_3 TaxID=2821113 RepID=UPI001ADA3618|nr:hypothetical protein [Shimia sp. R9_3]MBO9401183.1 hypothetical protein [Shimia sp. R9_3]
MTKKTEHKSEYPTCVALDGSICRQPVAEDGRGILCEKHMTRLRLGENITISKQAGRSAETVLDSLIAEFGGSANITNKESNSNTVNAVEQKSGSDVQEQRRAGSSGSAKDRSETSINLISIAVLSVFVTAYAALILYIQAPRLDLPFGMTLSGFNSTTAALHNLPLVLLVTFLAAIILIFTSIAAAFVSGFLLLMFALIGRVVQNLSLMISTMWVRFAVGKRFLMFLHSRREDPSRPVLVERALNKIEKLLNRIISWLGKARLDTRKGIRYAMGFPYQVIYLGKGPQGRVVFARLAVVALVLALGIPLAILNADDRDRQVFRVAAENENCANYGLNMECPQIQPNKILDLFDAQAALARKYNQQTNDDGTTRVAGEATEIQEPPLFAQLSLWARDTFRPRVAVGTFVYSSRDTAPTASHVEAEPGTLGKTSFRTEPVVHIGDFGDWVYVAKVVDPKKRLLIRRSAVLEFSLDTRIKVLNPPEDEPKTGTEALVTVLQQQNTELRTQVNALQIHLQEVNVKALNGLKIAATHRSKRFFALVPIVQNFVHGNGGGGTSIFPDLGALVSHGVASRAPSVIDDLVRRHGNAFIATCVRNGISLRPIQFAENQARWPEGNAPKNYGHALAHLGDLMNSKKSENSSNLVFLRGGASFTGSSEANLRLSEKRAKWVKTRLLADLFNDRTSNAADLASQASSEQKLHFVAFGMGERMPTGATSGRAVEIFVCELKTPSAMPAPTEDQIAQN